MIKKDAEADGKWVSDCGISQMKWLANTSAWTPYLPLPRTRNLEEAPSRIDITTIGNEQTETTICERETQIRSQLRPVADHDMSGEYYPSQKISTSGWVVTPANSQRDPSISVR